MVPSPGGSRFTDYAAHERTLLAWIRTGIALMAFGFAIARFGLFLREIAAVGPLRGKTPHAAGSAWFGVTLVLLGLLTNLASVVRFGALHRAIEENRQVTPSPWLGYALGAVSVIVALVMAGVLADAIGN